MVRDISGRGLVKRWLLPTALLLSVGFNLGLLTSFLIDREDAPAAPAELGSVPPLEVLAPEEMPATVLAAPRGLTVEAEVAQPGSPPVIFAPKPAPRSAPIREAAAPDPLPRPFSESSGRTAAKSAVETEPSEGEAAEEQVAGEPAAGQQAAAEYSQEEPNGGQDRPVVRPTESQARDTQLGNPREAGARPPRSAARGGQVRDGVRRRPAQQVEFEKLAERLGLEGAQRDRFLSDHLDFTAKVRQIGPRMLRLRRQFFRELSAEQVDEGRIKRLTQQLGVANVALERALADVILKTRRHLDKAQQQAYLRFIQGRMDRIQEYVRRGAVQRPAPGQGGQRQRPHNPGRFRQRQTDERPDPPRP